MKNPRFDFTISGFMIAIILVSMFATVFALFLSGVEGKMGISSNSSFSHYNQTQDIVSYASKINQSTNIQQDKGLLDIIGAYFGAGYSAIKISFSSFGLFTSIMDEASADFEYFALFKTLFVSLVLIILVLLLVTVLVKWKL